MRRQIGGTVGGLWRYRPGHWTDLGGGVGVLQVEDLSCAVTWKWEGAPKTRAKVSSNISGKGLFPGGEREMERLAEIWDVHSPRPQTSTHIENERTQSGFPTVAREFN